MSRTSAANFTPKWVRLREEWDALSGSDRALWFVDAVETEKIPMCLRVKQACKLFRHYQEVHDWHPTRVDRVVKFVESLETPEGGDFATFTVLPWQALLAAATHGFTTKEKGERAVRETLLVVPRKAGKSAFAAALSLYEMIYPFGGGKSPHMALVGVSEKTATHTYQKMCGILIQDEIKFGRKGLGGQQRMKFSKKEIYCGKNNGKATMETMGAKALDGYTLQGFVVDEVANIPDRAGLETLRSGFIHASNPLCLLTTTPADLPVSCYDDELEHALKFLEGERGDRLDYFPLIFRAESDELEDAGDPRLWEKVQPSLGWSARVGSYVTEWQRMQGADDTRHKFYTRYLCAPSNLSGIWITSEQWLNTRDPRPEPVRDSDYTRWLIGIDLSDVRDTTAICVLGYDDLTDTAEVWFECHAPEGSIPPAETTGRRAAQMREWARDGHLILHPGRAINHQRVAERINTLAEKLRPLGIYGDNYIAINEVAYRAKEHVRPLFIKKGKTAMSMAEPMNTLVTLMENGRIRMQKHPVAIQHLKNTFIRINKQDGRLPEKFSEHSLDKIDCIDALLMSLFGYAQSKDDKLIGTDEAPIMSTGDLPGTNPQDTNPVVLN